MFGDRYISQNALIKEIAKIHGNLNTRNVGQAIWDAPTADVVDVVRCKDCVHYTEYGVDQMLDKRWGVCHRPLADEECCIEVEEKDYCSCGRRRGENEP